MRIMMLALALVLGSQTAHAASLKLLLRAAGVSTVPKQTAPDFQLPDMSGRMRRLHDQRGKVVFLNFWATWCPPCREEMPLMEALSQALRQHPFVMWAVNLQESQAQVAQFMTAHCLHFPALLDTDGAISARYMVRGLPTTYLIDCAGTMIGRVAGAREWTDNATRALLAALLNDDACRHASTERPRPEQRP
jgi:peroxiredoxin